MDKTFRTAAVGGFNRQDVIDYITKLSGEHQAEQQRLSKALEEAEAAGERALQEKSALEDTAAQLQARLDSLTAEREQLLAERQRLEAAAAERDALSEQVAALSAEAEQFHEMKSRIAELELDAHQRADGIVAQAEQTAAATLEAARQQAARVEAAADSGARELGERYQELQQDFSVAREHVLSELKKMETAFAQMPLAFDRFDAAIRALGKKNNEG